MVSVISFAGAISAPRVTLPVRVFLLVFFLVFVLVSRCVPRERAGLRVNIDSARFAKLPSVIGGSEPASRAEKRMLQRNFRARVSRNPALTYPRR